MTSVDAFEWVILAAHTIYANAPKEPGHIVNRKIPTDVRTGLQHLTSNDRRNVRRDVVAARITRIGFCDHGRFYTEHCPGCGR